MLMAWLELSSQGSHLYNNKILDFSAKLEKEEKEYSWY